MDLRQLSYVVAVVDEGGFTAAADELRITQPSLSQGVRSLEAELGVQLFHRTGRSVVLTAAGEAILEPARQALRDAATARAAVDAVSGLRAGRLDVVCLATLAVEPAADLIGRFRRAHPDVTVRLREPPAAGTLPDLVRDGTSEIGIAELPVSGGGLDTHPLEVHDYLAVLPPDSAGRFGSGRSVSLRRLASWPLITTPVGTSTRSIVDDALAGVGLHANVAVETEHRETIGPLVVAGAGVSVLPRPVAEDAERRGALLRTVSPHLRREIGLIHRHGPLSPAAQAFLDLALDG